VHKISRRRKEKIKSAVLRGPLKKKKEKKV